MAGIRKEERAARLAASKEGNDRSDDQEDDGLIEVTNGVEVLRVHPSCVEAHKHAGWKEV